MERDEKIPVKSHQTVPLNTARICILSVQHLEVIHTNFAYLLDFFEACFAWVGVVFELFLSKKRFVGHKRI